MDSWIYGKKVQSLTIKIDFFTQLHDKILVFFNFILLDLHYLIGLYVINMFSFFNISQKHVSLLSIIVIKMF